MNKDILFNLLTEDDKEIRDMIGSFRSEMGELSAKMDLLNQKMDYAIARYENMFYPQYSQGYSQDYYQQSTYDYSQVVAENDTLYGYSQGVEDDTLAKLNNVRGNDVADDYSRGWKEAITEAMRLIGDGRNQGLSNEDILMSIHYAGGADAVDDYSRGWDAAIEEAVRIVEDEFGLDIDDLIEDDDLIDDDLIEDDDLIDDDLMDEDISIGIDNLQNTDKAYTLASKVYKCMEFTFTDPNDFAEAKDDTITNIRSFLLGDPASKQYYVEYLTGLLNNNEINFTPEQHRFIDSVAVDLLSFDADKALEELSNMTENEDKAEPQIEEKSEDTVVLTDGSADLDKESVVEDKAENVDNKDRVVSEIISIDGAEAFNSVIYFNSWINKLDNAVLDKRIAAELDSIENIIDDLIRSEDYRIVHNDKNQLGILNLKTNDIQYFIKNNKISMSSFLIAVKEAVGNQYNENQIKTVYDNIKNIENEGKKKGFLR